MEFGMNIARGIDFKNMAMLYKKYGVKRTFLNYTLKDFDEILKSFIENGIVCETIHAPSENINDMWAEGEEGEAMLKSLMDTIDKCNEYNIPVAVVHISKGRPMPPINDIGLDRFDRLLNYAKEKNVKIAYENLRYSENVKVLLDRQKEAGFCWDTGHEACYTPGTYFMEEYSKRLSALHIHDNACVYDSDDHVLPFDGNVDMERIAKYIATSGYEGTVMLELAKIAKLNGEELYTHLTDDEYVNRAVCAAKRLRDMVQSYKKN